MTDDASPSYSSPSNSGGVILAAERIDIGGDVVGRDKIFQNIQHIYERALTATEEAERAHSIEARYLAQGVSAFAQRLQARAGESADTGKGGPYKGLLEYRLSDAEIFFGRERAIRELLEHLPRSPLTVLHAESGAGKTSLLQAGISPHLIAAGHLPIYLRPYNIVPSLALKRAFLPNLSNTPHLAQAPLRDFLSRVRDVLGGKTTLTIFLDQFEEFFTQLEDVARPEFVRELAECLDDESLNVRWVLALRSEYFGALASFRPRIRNPFENDYRLNRLTRDEAREAVAEPAARRGITFEDGLIDTVLDDLGKDEVAPPQVQLVCSTLYEALPPDAKIITRELYTTSGGAAGILRGHLGRVLKRDLPAGQRPIAQRLLEELITSDVRRVMRTHAELADRLAVPLAAQGVQAETLDAVLGQLVDSRLLRIEETEGQAAYELAHDYLLDEIKLDPAVQARKAAQELLDQEVRAYQRHGTLLSDDKLAIIEARRGELALNDDARTLIQKSERALKRRQRFVFGGIGLVIVLFIVGALSVLAAIGAQSVADQARIQQATSEAGAAAAATNEAGANESAATATAREAIANSTLKRAFEKSGIVPVGDIPSALAFDGTRLWVANIGDDTVQVIDPVTGRVSEPISIDGNPSALAFDGTRLWVASSNGTVQAIDPATGDLDAPIPVGNHPVALALDPLRGRLWVANSDDDTVQAIDLATGAAGAPVPTGFVGPRALAFDGAQLWVAGRHSSVEAMDAETGDIGIRVPLDESARALAFDGTRLWIVDGYDHTVRAINPATGEVYLPISVGINPIALTFDGTRLWVANSGDHTVQAIDPTTGDTGAPIPVGLNPSDLVFDGTRLWVANQDDDTVQMLVPDVGDAGTSIQVGSGPSALAFDGTRLWVANSFDNTVQMVNPITKEAGEPIPVGDRPLALTFDTLNAQLWVANWIGNTVQPIDPMTGQAGTPITVGSFPTALAIDNVHARLWVANSQDDTVQAIDLTTGSLGVPLPAGDAPTALIFDGIQLWVASWNDNTVRAIDPATGKAKLTISVPQPDDLVFDGTQLWVASVSSQVVHSIDPPTGEIVASIAAGVYPSAITFDGMLLWVADRNNDIVRAFDPDTGALTYSVKVGNSPSDLTFDGRRVWVANRRSNTVQYIVVHKRVDK